jgi:ParB family chromosome partitioning protein
LQSIVVCSAPDEYFSIIAGERHFWAMQMLGKSTVAARIIEACESDCTIISLIENLQKEYINPIEEAAGFFRFVCEFGFTQEHVVQRVGKERVIVGNALRLLHLEEDVLR